MGARTPRALFVEPPRSVDAIHPVPKALAEKVSRKASLDYFLFIPEFEVNISRDRRNPLFVGFDPFS